MTLTNLISSIPDGVLLLFASYAMMQNLKEAWESENGIWTRLSSLKVNCKKHWDFRLEILCLLIFFAESFYRTARRKRGFY